jgi:hypothetical protein
MSRLEIYEKDLYELRFSPMCKPAGEVANLTMLESHTVRARMMMLWRVATGLTAWGKREVELLYQTTLDSISEAFDIFHYPVSQIMLAARADVWEAGLVPESVARAVEIGSALVTDPPNSETVLVAGEIAQLNDERLLAPLLKAAGPTVAAWVIPTGALAYALGVWEVAEAQAQAVVTGLKAGGAQTVIADGPETAWALTKIYPALGIDWPEEITVKLLSQVLAENDHGPKQAWGKILVHDSRPACLIAEAMANHRAILPGYLELEADFGQGVVYDAPRHVLDALGAERIFGNWTRSLAKTSGADDGLWLTYPHLAAGLAIQRLDFAERLGADLIVTDSPLAASFLHQHAFERAIRIKLLAEFVD